MSLDFDIREQQGGPVAAEPQWQGQERFVVEQRAEAIAAFLSSGVRDPGLKLTPNQYGLPKSLFHERTALTAPSRDVPEQIAKDFLRAYRRVFPFTSSELENLRLLSRSTDQGAAFLTFNQTLNGIDVFRGHVKLVLNPAGQVVQAGVGEVVPNLSLATNPRPLLSKLAF